MVLHKSRDLGRSLGLIIHCTVNLHVPVQNLQEIFLALLGGEKETDWSARLRAKGENRLKEIKAELEDCGGERFKVCLFYATAANCSFGAA